LERIVSNPINAFDIVGFIMDVEDGTLSEEQLFVEGFQHLIDTGLAWNLQGAYGRTAQALIDQGLCHLPT
jgi:hypothetical protein